MYSGCLLYATHCFRYWRHSRVQDRYGAVFTAITHKYVSLLAWIPHEVPFNKYFIKVCRAASLVALVSNPPASAGDVGSIPGLGRSPGECNRNPLQYSCLENWDRGAWWAEVHGGHKRVRCGSAIKQQQQQSLQKQTTLKRQRSRQK